MAAKMDQWEIRIDDVGYVVKTNGSKIWINNNEPKKVKEYIKKSGLLNRICTIPLGENEAILYLPNMGKPVLTYNDVDCLTGETFLEPKVPGWGWIFIVLHIIDFFLFVGGAVGGVLQLFLITTTANIASNPKKKTSQKVLACLGLYILALIPQVVFAVWYVSGMLF